MRQAERLPDFLIIGAMKAGTTTLYDLLRRHPDVGMSREKETDFLLGGANWSRGLNWYCGQFDPSRRVLGEASPNYTKRHLFGGVPERAAAIVPGARLIFLARDPVARAASQYRHQVLSGATLPGPEALSGSATLRHLIETSRYAHQITAWRGHYPDDRFLFLDFDRMTLDPAPALSRLAAFLDIADAWPALGPAANSADSLARLPPWLFSLRQHALGRRIKDLLSPEARSRLKAAFTGRRVRSAPDLPPAIRAEIAAAVAEDAARFRALSGLTLERWPV